MISLPLDANNKPIQLSPSKSAVAATYDATISSATSINLNAATTFLEISAIDKGVFMRYAAGASSSAFDEFIPANQSKQYIVPAGVTVISVIEESATGKVAVIEK